MEVGPHTWLFLLHGYSCLNSPPLLDHCFVLLFQMYGMAVAQRLNNDRNLFQKGYFRQVLVCTHVFVQCCLYDRVIVATYIRWFRPAYGRRFQFRPAYGRWFQFRPAYGHWFQLAYGRWFQFRPAYGHWFQLAYGRWFQFRPAYGRWFRLAYGRWFRPAGSVI